MVSVAKKIGTHSLIDPTKYYSMWGLNITTLTVHKNGFATFVTHAQKLAQLWSKYYPPGQNIQVVVVGTSPKNSFRSPGKERNSVAECSLSVSRDCCRLPMTDDWLTVRSLCRSLLNATIMVMCSSGNCTNSATCHTCIIV